MACYVCHYKKLNCTEGCPFARFFDEGNISIYDKISKFEHHRVLKEKLRPCSMAEGRRIIEQSLIQANARIPNLDLCNPCRFLEVYDCKGDLCDLRQYFDTESGLAKLEAIVKLKTKKFFVSNFRKAGGKKAARVDAWYREAVRASTVEVPANEEDKASFNRVKEAMGEDWVRKEFHAFVIEIATKAADAARAPAEEEVKPLLLLPAPAPAPSEEEVKPLLLLSAPAPAPAEEEFKPEAEEVKPETVAASPPLLLPAPAGRSRRCASILAKQRIVAVFEKEEEEDNEDED